MAAYCANEFELSGAEWDEKGHHSPYPSNLAPSDSYLFGYVKQLSVGQEFPSRGAFLGAVQNILRDIEN
jgi:hypothetical protein